MRNSSNLVWRLKTRRGRHSHELESQDGEVTPTSLRSISRAHRRRSRSPGSYNSGSEDEAGYETTEETTDLPEPPRQRDRDHDGTYDLCFNIEMEMTVTVLKTTIESSGKSDILELIAAYLAESLNVRLASGADDEVVFDNAYSTDWLVTTAEDVQLEGPKPNAVTVTKSVKIVSPVSMAIPALSSGQLGQQLGVIREVLQRHFHVKFNSSTGLHVRVGSSQGYEMRQLKNLGIIVCLVEPILDKIHPIDRRNFLRSNRSNSTLVGKSPAEMAQTIQTTRTPAALKTVLNSVAVEWHGAVRHEAGSFFKYDFLSIDSSWRAVAFRQHRGTLNPDEIIHWYELVRMFVCRAITLSEREMEVVINWGDEKWRNVGLDGLFHFFRLADSSREYFRLKRAVMTPSP